MRTFIVISCVILVASHTASAAEEPDVTGTEMLAIFDQRGILIPERMISVSIYENSEIIVYRKTDGTFESAQDFDRQLNFYRSAGEKLCYITGNHRTDYRFFSEVDDALRYPTGFLFLVGIPGDYTPLEEYGRFTDTPLIPMYTIPDYIKSECADGFMFARSSTGGGLTFIEITTPDN